MNEIILSKLCLRNFQGIKEFCLDTQSKNVSIYGDNGIGKTTLFNAFLWLLFDKNSEGKKDFQIKTLDRDGNVLHNLEHEVEAVLIVDGNSVTLKKVFSEKWTKKRGSATQEFSGHTTDYYIDGVPVKLKEYKDRVDSIISEDVFKLLTSPTYFNEQLKWQDRRKTLLEVCGDISSADVIASNEALAKLPAILGNRSIEDHRKVIAAKRAEINKELDKIPVRIDEVHRTMPDTSELDEKKLQQQIDIIKGRIEAKEAELSRIQSGGEISLKEKQMREIESELLQINNQLQADTLKKVSDKRVELMSSNTLISQLRQQINDKKYAIERNERNIAIHKDDAGRYRELWHDVNTKTFEHHHHDDNCPTCGQSLPEEHVKSAHEKALAKFNLEKSKELESVTSKGKSAAMEVRKLEQQNVDLQDEIESLNQQLQAKETTLQSIEADLNTLQAGMKDVGDDLQYSLKKQDLAAIQQEINGLRSSTQESLSAVKDEIAKLRYQVDLLEQDKSKFVQVKAANQRIDDLKRQEKDLATEFERLEQELYLTETFIRTKVSLLESKINGKFKHARFRLFESQINGGLSEVCETLYGGVPYSNVNTAGKIQIGMDIISTLQEHYGFTATIWIDNRESIVKLPEMNCQVISLIVSEQDKKLRVETIGGE